MSKQRKKTTFSLPRRGFLQSMALGAGAWAVSKLPVMAGPFENENEYLRLIPEDKKLDPAWVRSLFLS